MSRGTWILAFALYAVLFFGFIAVLYYGICWAFDIPFKAKEVVGIVLITILFNFIYKMVAKY